MATDYVTSPVTNLGKIIYGIGIGALTVIIRNFGVYPEGVSFAILSYECCYSIFRPIKTKNFSEQELRNENIIKSGLTCFYNSNYWNFTSCMGLLFYKSKIEEQKFLSIKNAIEEIFTNQTEFNEIPEYKIKLLRIIST